MDYFTDAMEMVDDISQPAFCVREGLIVKVNAAARSRMLEPGTPVGTILLTGSEEYAEFSGGRLYLTLSVCAQPAGAAVSRKNGFDLFLLEQESDAIQLRAMALAAQQLREPLSSVMLAADRLFESAGLTGIPGADTQAANINKGLFQLLRIVSNMSDASRYGNDAAPRQETREICGLVAEVVDHAAALAEYTGVILEYTGLPEQIFCPVDAEKLERAVFNILSNAIKFSQPGSTVRAKLTRHGSKLHLSVQDSGFGIPEALRSSMFIRYTREPGVEDGRFGVGLGMRLICCAASQHGGTVLVDQPGPVGTRITMTIAIRRLGGTLRSPRLHIDYAGERDHGLIELSDSLPAALYDPKRIN